MASQADITRRSMLVAAPAFGLVRAYTPVTEAQAGGDMAHLWHQAEAIKARLNRPDADLDSPEWEADYDRLIVLQDEISSRPAQCLKDWAAKVLNADDGGMFTNCNVWADALLAEARALIGA
jgi:hypothetical protein